MLVAKILACKWQSCLDQKPLSQALKRWHNLQFSWTYGATLPVCSRARVFTCYDITSGFWHIKLSDESRTLTAVATPSEGWKLLNMVMGCFSKDSLRHWKSWLAYNNCKACLYCSKREGDTEAEWPSVLTGMFIHLISVLPYIPSLFNCSYNLQLNTNDTQMQGLWTQFMGKPPHF